MKGVDAGLQALMVMAMDAGNEMALAMGDKELADRCAKASKKLKKYIPDHNQSKQGAALMALAGLMKAEKADKDVLSVGGAQGFSTFYGYYMLEAMAKAGNYQGAKDIRLHSVSSKSSMKSKPMARLSRIFKCRKVWN